MMRQLNWASALLALTVSTAVIAGDVYVAPTGSDANAGTQAAPWRTIQKAARTVTPGTTVHIASGSYADFVDVLVSGTAQDGPIVFVGEGATRPVLRAPAVLRVATNGVPMGLINIRDRGFITLRNLDFTGYTGRADGASFAAGISVSGTSNNISITGNRIYAIRGSANFKQGAHGIGVYGTDAATPLTALTISGNELYALRLGQSEALAINGNVSGWSVTGNSVHDTDNIGIVAIGYEQTAADPAVDRARDGVIADNIVYNIDSNRNPSYPPNSNGADGIYVDGGTRVLIERNIVHHTNIGIEVASEHRLRTSSYVTVRSNLLYANYGPAISLGGYAANVGSTDHAVVINNTLVGNNLRRVAAELQLQYFPRDGTATANVFANNIISPTAAGVMLFTSFNNPQVALNSNLYDGKPVAVEWDWNGRAYTTLAAFRAASGNDALSSVADPQYLGRATLDFRVKSTSPAVDRGQPFDATTLGALDVARQPRVTGAAVDIGAYER